jgi:hypothetical protein
MEVKDITIKNNDSKYIIILVEYYVWFGLFTRKKRAYTENHKPIGRWFWLGTDKPTTYIHTTLSAMYYHKAYQQAKAKLNEVKAEYEAHLK